MERLNTSWELLASPPGRGDAKLGLPTTHHQHPNPNQRPSFPTTMNTRTDNAVVSVWGKPWVAPQGPGPNPICLFQSSLGQLTVLLWVHPTVGHVTRNSPLGSGILTGSPHPHSGLESLGGSTGTEVPRTHPRNTKSIGLGLCTQHQYVLKASQVMRGAGRLKNHRHQVFRVVAAPSA